MSEEFQQDATKAFSDLKGVIAAVDADIPKVKTFFTDYRLYLICAACLIVGGIAGGKIAALLHHL